MTERDDLDLLLDRFFADGPIEIADDVIEASLLTIDTTHQRRAGFGPRRNVAMSTDVARFSLAAAAVVAVAVVGTLVLPGIQRNVGGSPPPSSMPSAPLAAVASPPGTSVRPSPQGSKLASPLAPFGYRGPGTIVFARHDAALDGDTTWTIRPDGTGETALRVGSGWGGTTSLPGTGCCAVLSPDGTQVAVGYDEINPERAPGVSTAARILNLDGSNTGPPANGQTDLNQLIPQFCGGCSSIMGIDYVPRAWSADGSMIATEVWSDAGSTWDGINIAPLGTARDWEIQVTGQHRDVPLAFSPDGTELLFVRLEVDRTGTLMLATVSSTKGIVGVGTPRPISPAGTRIFADGYFGPAASWSPDGRRIAFAATDATGSTAAMSVYVVAADGGTPKAIAGPASYITSARWSPDGTWIAFDQPTSGSVHDEFIIRPDGSQPTNLTADFGPGVCCGRWSPDSAALLVAGTMGTDEESDLLVVPLDGGAVAQVTRTPAFYSDFAWGPAQR